MNGLTHLLRLFHGRIHWYRVLIVGALCMWSDRCAYGFHAFACLAWAVPCPCMSCWAMPSRALPCAMPCPFHALAHVPCMRALPWPMCLACVPWCLACVPWCLAAPMSSAHGACQPMVPAPMSSAHGASAAPMSSAHGASAHGACLRAAPMSSAHALRFFFCHGLSNA